MDENLGYSGDDDDDKRISSSQWNIAQESNTFLDRDSSQLFLKYQNYHLHLIQKREPSSERLIIPSTKNQRLCYFRNYVSSPNKTQIACMHQKSFNMFFWQYVMNSVHKTLQHTYVNIFLASYVPEEHLFLSKMVPIMHGIKYSFILTGLLEVVTYISTTIILLDYLVGSIFLKNPWNNCPKSGIYYYKASSNHTYAVNCYNVLDFGNKVKNKTVVFIKHFYYIQEDSELLQLVQIAYFRYRLLTMSGFVKLIYTCFIWGLIALFYKQIFKKNFWKMYNIIYWCVIAIDVASFVYVTVYYIYEDEDVFVPSISLNLPTVISHAFSFSDIDFLAESTTAPPVVHVLTARSTQEILPGRDSAIIVISNAICFLLRALLSYRVKQHCENLVRVPILLPGFLANAWLYFWPMYFSTFYLGDIYTLVFLLFNFALEIMTTVVTFQCLVEAVVSEWPMLERWLVSFLMIIIAVGFAHAVPVDLSIVLGYNKSTATLLECIVLYCMYPLFRLTDDIFFHYGSPPHYIRVQLMIIVPGYYMYNYYRLIKMTTSSLLPLISSKNKLAIIHAMIWAFSLILIPIVLGFVYVTYKYVMKSRRGWRCMFAPTEDWGPRDYNTRQLRKDYDSRTYNSSEAPRSLSRHIISRAESKTYRLDIRYDQNRRSTLPNYDLKIENEKYL